MFLLFFLALFSLHADYPHRFEGNFESWNHRVFDLAALALPEDPVIVEAGAFLGEDTVAMAVVWPHADIYSFEPNPRACSIASTRLSFFKTVQMFPLALNDAPGMTNFYLCRGTYGDNPIYESSSSLLKPAPCMEVHYQGPIISVQCVRLEDWAKTNEIERIDFLRLDVQGSELQVLKSAGELLRTVRVLLVRTNFFPFREEITEFSSLRSFLEKEGFILLSHWYREGLEGNALFLNDDLVLGETRLDPFDESKYTICSIEPPLDASFFVDDVPDSIKKHLKEGRYFEGTIGRLIDKYVKTGTAAIDIGAHIGVHTIAMSRKAGPSGAVVAFEPQRKIYQEQLHNLKLNQCNNVLSIRKALGNESGTIELTPRNPENEGGTSIGSGGDTAEIIPLDSLNLQNVSLIKIDVECTEYAVFEGARQTILRNKPVILFEVMGPYNHRTCPAEIKEKIQQTLALVASMGYEITPLFSSNDFIAIPKKQGQHG